MPDQTLGIILQATAQNAAAYDQMIAKNEALKASGSQLNTIYGAQGQVLADLTQTMGTASTAHEKVTKGAGEAATAERDLTKEGGEAARAMSALGASGSEVFDRFSSLAGMMGSGGGLGIAMGAALVGIGALVEGSKSVSETYQEQQNSLLNLNQAVQAQVAGLHQQAVAADTTTGLTQGLTGAQNDQVDALRGLSDEYDAFAQANAAFIPNINTGRDALAGFARAGFDAKTSMEAENVTVDLAAMKHEDLATAGQQVLLMMEGNGKLAKSLGIDMKTLSASSDTTTAALKNLGTANKDVATAQDTLTKALRSQKEEQDALHGKKVISQHDLDVEQDKAAAVKTAQDNLTKALQGQKTAQDASNNSVADAQKRLDELSVKTDGARNSLTDLEKQQNINKAEWDDFSSRAGPAVNYMFEVITGTVSGLIQLLDGAAQGIQWLSAHAGDAVAAGNAAATSAGTTPNYGPGNLRRAAGGPVYPGGVYTVGEAGPETLRMGAAGGYVTPGAGGGGMDDTNELLATAVQLLAQVAANTKGSTFTTGAWNPV